MCNLNILIKNRKPSNIYQLINFLECATTESYLYNNDGDGVYFDYTKKLIRNKNKIALNKYPKEIQRSKFIITHQRLATHGKTFHYTQPFSNNGFVFVHNGILTNYDFDNNKSDSYNFFNEFIKKYKKSKKKTREKKILEGLSLLSKSKGSFSIALFDVKEKRLYYVKDNYTNINFFRTKDKDLLYITTRETNKAYLELYTDKYEELSIQSKKIYRIYISKEKVFLKPLVDLKQGKNQRQSNSKEHYVSTTHGEDNSKSYEFNSKGHYVLKQKRNKLISFFRDSKNNQSISFNPNSLIKFKWFKAYFGFYSGVNRRKCGICAKQTTNKNQHNSTIIYCDKCISENHDIFLNKFNEDNPHLSYV